VHTQLNNPKRKSLFEHSDSGYCDRSVALHLLTGSTALPCEELSLVRTESQFYYSVMMAPAFKTCTCSNFWSSRYDPHLFVRDQVYSLPVFQFLKCVYVQYLHLHSLVGPKLYSFRVFQKSFKICSLNSKCSNRAEIFPKDYNLLYNADDS
jgi:hypothetical protein